LQCLDDGVPAEHADQTGDEWARSTIAGFFRDLSPHKALVTLIATAGVLEENWDKGWDGMGAKPTPRGDLRDPAMRLEVARSMGHHLRDVFGTDPARSIHILELYYSGMTKIEAGRRAKQK